mgnify:CR=1 FL=1
MKWLLVLMTMLWALGLVPVTSADNGFSEEGSALCISCHDFGPQSPVHALMEGSHGLHKDSDAMRERRGCEDCHGPSASHAASPTQVSPGVSFGPRWSASGAEQDSACLACHEQNTAVNWRDAMHMVKGVTCVSCHDIHTGGDKVLFESRQAEVCTMCHKAQKAGIHGLGGKLDAQPACSTCHNPHDHESAKTQMLLTRSAGCRTCHDLVTMANDPTVSEKATNYHKVMASPERTCIECHGGITHADHDAVTAFTPRASHRSTITLFYPGNADSEWLTENHPGSQPLRQGANCQLCHRGDEASMGAALANQATNAARSIDISFSLIDEALLLRLRWRGEPDDSSVSIMWGGTNTDDSFRRGGCFAACHNDMEGMSKDRGQATGKYLWSSRAQRGQLGQPAIVKSEAALREMLQSGAYAILWQVDLSAGEARAASVLDKLRWEAAAPLGSKAIYQDGWWDVTLRQPLDNQSPVLLSLDPVQRYTFGVALHGPGKSGAAHWVSLPFTLGGSGDDTDFVVQ